MGLAGATSQPFPPLGRLKPEPVAVLPDLPESRCRNIVAGRARSGMLVEGEVYDPKRRENVVGIVSVKRIGEQSEGED